MRDRSELRPSVRTDAYILSFRNEFAPYTDVAPPFWLVTYLVEPAGSHEFVMKNSRGDAVGCVSVKDVMRDDLMRDAERGRGG
jgi:hypothetical protein